MANQRKQGKKQVNSWVSEELAERIRQLAEQEGKPVSKIVEEILRQQVEKYEKEHGENG